MLCKKCRKEIPDGSIYCNYCGKKQETTKRKTRRRARGTGTIRYKPEYKNRPYVVSAPRTTSAQVKSTIELLQTAAEGQQAALDSYFNSTHIDHSSLTLAQAYENGVRSILKPYKER
ncbi:MAG: zinc-ribbon domain-containing protein [Ruminococcus sp.]